jgi:two-component system, response regulator YesN
MMARGETRPSAVLIVDDEVAIGDVMRRMLGRLLPAATIGAVLSAAQAIEVLMAQPIDLVLTDVRMPVMDGVQLTQLIKARWPEIRVVLFSGMALVDLELAALAGQADGYLVKPINRDTLAQVVHRVLSN